jgi:hypothetical protein
MPEKQKRYNQTFRVLRDIDPMSPLISLDKARPRLDLATYWARLSNLRLAKWAFVVQEPRVRQGQCCRSPEPGARSPAPQTPQRSADP